MGKKLSPKDAKAAKKSIEADFGKRMQKAPEHERNGIYKAYLAAMAQVDADTESS